MIKYFMKNPEHSLTRGTIGSAGFDIRADIGTSREIMPFERWKISTGLHVSFPAGLAMQICSRSGLAINHGIVVANAPGIVDSDYRGTRIRGPHTRSTRATASPRCSST
jgi:deoxyuridine 5'-triphosphate nucleotidohydrolase